MSRTKYVWTRFIIVSFFSLQTSVWRVVSSVEKVYGVRPASVRPSVRPSVCPSVCPSVNCMWSIWIKAISSFSFRPIFFKFCRKLLWVGALKTCFPEFWFRSGFRIYWPFCPVNNLVNKSYLLLQFSTDFFQTLQECSLHDPSQNLFFGILI